MRHPLLGRFLVVAGVTLALLVPLAAIRDKVSERRDRAHSVQKAFAAETSGAQVIAGPFLALTCEETYIDGGETKQRPCATALVLPAELNVEAHAPVEQRFRGIYPIRLYRATLSLSGSFTLPAPRGSRQAWKDAYFVLAIKDVRGIKAASGTAAGGRALAWLPGPFDAHADAGLHASLGRHGSLPSRPDFTVALELAGTERLEMAPVGGQTRVRLESDWRHPSFVGAYSPDQRDIRPSGFSARWAVSELSTGGNAFWAGKAGAGKLLSAERLLGVAWIEPVNPYSMSYRATEYGFLFILLTFAAFALVELAWQVKLHPVQYALTGLALAVFFLLLISLSEHVRFDLAYATAAGACVALLAAYLRHPLGNVARTAVFTLLFCGLYGALYLLLRSEDHSLLLGSLLVFGVLAAVMLLTRKLDWAALSGRLRQPLADAP